MVRDGERWWRDGGEMVRGWNKNRMDTSSNKKQTNNINSNINNNNNNNNNNNINNNENSNNNNNNNNNENNNKNNTSESHELRISLRWCEEKRPM